MHIKDKMNAFKGPVATCLIPAYSSQVLASGILKILGRIVVHSLLQGGPGFPFLTPYVYKYITTENIDQKNEGLWLSTDGCLLQLYERQKCLCKNLEVEGRWLIFSRVYFWENVVYGKAQHVYLNCKRRFTNCSI